MKLVKGKGATDEDMVAVIIALAAIGKTKSGASIINELINGETEYTIIVTRNPDGFVPNYDVESKTLRLNVGWIETRQYLGSDAKWYQDSVARTLAHELGHIFINYETSPEESEQAVVDKYENPIMKDLGDLNKRGKYGPHKRGGRVPGKRFLIPRPGGGI